MSDKNADTIVAVTGASGFIGLRCVLELLRAGYRVRGTLRDPNRAAGLRATLAKHVDAGGRLEFVTADLMRDDGWAAAVKDCTYALHVASPIPRYVPEDENELILPARDGTRRVLAAALEAGVKRVVMTSSVAAVAYGHEADASRVYNEDDWSVVNSGLGAYSKSKTLAERAAWDYVGSLAKGDQLELAVINPGMVYGPILDDDYGTSGELVRKLMKRQIPGCANLGWAPVDVRDVAAAHIAAMTNPKAAGKRFCCAIEHAWMSQVAAILQAHFAARGYRIPTRKVPDIVLHIFALFDKPTRIVVNDIGRRTNIDNTRIKTVLNWQPRSLEEMVVSMGESMIEHGVV